MQEFAPLPALLVPVGPAGPPGCVTEVTGCALPPPVTPESLQASDIDELRDVHRALLAHLRDVEHWYRLVAARLDLAVAAVTELDEPAPEGSAGNALHRLLGIPTSDGRLAESGLLLALREAMRDLDLASVSLRGQAGVVAAELGRRQVPQRGVGGLPAPRRPAQ